VKPPRPHTLFQVWSPDEVAECLSGVTPEEYSLLWSLVDKVAVRGETPDTCFKRSLSSVWRHVPAEMKTHLNGLAKACMAECAAAGRAA
jgi:hypothetical protein